MAKLVAEGDLSSAESELRRVVGIEDHAAARDLLGVVAARQGRVADAEREFLRAVELDPGLAAPRQNLGRLYVRQGRSEEALRELRAALGLGPLERELAFQLAALEIARGDVSAGEKLFESIAVEYHSVRATLELARSLARRGEGQMAIGVVNHAVGVAPNSEDVLSAYARLCVEHEAPVPAMKTLEALTRLHPTNAEYFYLLGLAQLQLAESDGAVAALRRSLELDPERVLSLFALGLSFRDQKRFAEAKEALTESLRLLPSHADALVVMAEVEEGLGELDLAEQHLRRAFELGGETPEALYVLGKIRHAQGRYEEARDALERSIEKNPRPRKAHYVLSLAYARLG
ncbi:MAG: tetratricopeptide repeat protein, partial [Acidobacteriota bacterium]|nr:tetratricopeptide repeat protein [Acidobacteriota bacterium]